MAQGFVAGGGLTVQACRVAGDSSAARLTVESQALLDTEPETISLVCVATPNAARKAELTELGLDLTEHGGARLRGGRAARRGRRA